MTAEKPEAHRAGAMAEQGAETRAIPEWCGSWGADNADGGTPMTDYEAVREVLSRYTRAVDWGNGRALTAICADRFVYEIYHQVDGREANLIAGPVVGADTFAALVEQAGRSDRTGTWGHHFTSDHIIRIVGDSARMSAQFFAIQSDCSVVDPVSARRGISGSVKPISSGYYDMKLARQGGQWKLAEHRIYVDLAFGAVSQDTK